MKKKFFIPIVVIIILFPQGISWPQTRSQEPNCCFLIYATGRWLGWAASLLEYTRERTRPVKWDSIILKCLWNVLPNVQNSNRQCSRTLQAWPTWRQKQQWIKAQIERLRATVDPVRYHRWRNDVWRNIEQTYHSWAYELSIVSYNGRIYRRTTCATCYFQLGFDTAYAAQAFRQADESYRFNHMRKFTAQISRARRYLNRSLNVLKSYYDLQRGQLSSFSVRCVNLDRVNPYPRIQAIVRAAIGPYNYLGYKDEAAKISDEIASAMFNGCSYYNRNRNRHNPSYPPSPQPPSSIPSSPPPPNGSQSPYSHARGFAGVWKTTWGIMRLNADGSGTYTHDKGRIRGTIRGRVLLGTWSEAPSYAPPKDAGDVKFVLSEDGNSFIGYWRYGSKGPWHENWRGKRIR